MLFLIGILIGITAGVALTHILSTRRQRSHWERAIAERRQAERRGQRLAQELSEVTVAHKTELRSLTASTTQELSQHKYLLRRADSALAAARAHRDQQAAEIASLQGVELSQTA